MAGFEYEYYNWGPFLMKIKAAPEHFNALKEISDKNREQGFDGRSGLAGRLELEKGLYQESLSEVESILKPYFIDYLSETRHMWQENYGFDSKENSVLFLSATAQKLYLSAAWCNYQQKKEYQPLHQHSGLLSFVFYLQVPEEIKNEENLTTSDNNGTINFHYNSREQCSMTDHIKSEHAIFASKLTQSIIVHNNILPEPGDLFIFPSYLQHSVNHFESDVTRISMSGNWNIKE